MSTILCRLEYVYIWSKTTDKYWQTYLISDLPTTKRNFPWCVFLHFYDFPELNHFILHDANESYNRMCSIRALSPIQVSVAVGRMYSGGRKKPWMPLSRSSTVYTYSICGTPLAQSRDVPDDWSVKTKGIVWKVTVCMMQSLFNIW